MTMRRFWGVWYPAIVVPTILGACWMLYLR